MMKHKPYRLSNLVAQCDPSASIPDELRAWEQGAPVGLEQMVMINQVWHVNKVGNKVIKLVTNEVSH